MLDFEEDTCEVLKVVDDKPEILFEQVGETMPIGTDCLLEVIKKHDTGLFIMLPVTQALEMKRAYEAKNQKKNGKH